MSLSAWPSSHNGDFVLVLNRYLDDSTKRIDGDIISNNNNDSLESNSTNYRAVARCELLKTCCTAFEHHFHTYKSIFSKMSAAIDVLSNAFEQHYKTNQQVDQWKQMVMKREDVLREQMKGMVEQHEREYATEAELKRKLALVEQNLANVKNDLDHTYRAYVRSEDALKDANERNDQLSRQHVMLTLRESRMREDALNLERQVEVSHQHAESKAREVGELRQEIALLNGKLYRVEAKIRETEVLLQTATQTLQRKSRELEDKEMELARVLKNTKGRNSNNDDDGGGGGGDEASNHQQLLQEKIKEAVAEREKEIMRACTPRPDWELLFENYQTRSQLVELVKPSEQSVVVNSAKNAGNANKTTPGVSSKRWTEMLTYALQNSHSKNQSLIEEVERRKEQADSAELQLALSTQQHQSSTNSKANRLAMSVGAGGKSVRAGAGLFGASTKDGGGGGGGQKSKQQQRLERNLKNAAFVYLPLSAPTVPDYLRSTKPIPGRMWQQGDIYKVLAAAVDFIIANNNNNNNSIQQHNTTYEVANTNNNNSNVPLDGSFTFGSGVSHNTNATTSTSTSTTTSHHRRLQHRQSSMSEAQLHQQLAGAIAAIDQQQQRQFADAFNAYLVASFGDAATRREIAYNVVYHCRQTFPNDVFCRAFLLSLGGDVPADTCQRIRTFVMAFRRSFEVCDSRCSGYISKKTMTSLIKNLMSMYSATEQKIVLALLDELPQMASRSETLVDYRVLFAPSSTISGTNNINSNSASPFGPASSSSNVFSISINNNNGASATTSNNNNIGGGGGFWERPSQFMTLVAAIYFRAMLIDMEAAINAVRGLATVIPGSTTTTNDSNTAPPTTTPQTTSINNANATPASNNINNNADISVGALLSALQSCDQKRDYDVHKEFISKCIITPPSSTFSSNNNNNNSMTSKAARITLELLIPRMRRTYLPRASVFPADPRFQYPEGTHVAVKRDDGLTSSGDANNNNNNQEDKQEN